MCAYRSVWPALVGLLCAAVARAELDPHLSDIGVRIDYGFHAEEYAVVEAARLDLEQLTGPGIEISYFRALAAWRLAQLATARGRSGGRVLAECLDSAEEATRQNPASAEPWILVAACSILGARTEPAKALFHGRRFEQAVARAHGLEPANPRLALVDAWWAGDGSPRSAAGDAAASITALETALEAFRVRTAKTTFVEWGEAETCAWLGALHLQRGDLRAARDLIEQALLAAPGYAFALDLRHELQAAR